jgi:pimeloyl-ACP methyl ester carboxylesterase
VTHELIKFDQRGGGLSDWEVENILETKMITDMESVVKATNLNKFALLGISQGCAFSIRYAYENPDHVSCLILFGGYTRGS